MTDPMHLRAGRDVVHAVEAPQHGGLAAARRPDERGDLLARRRRGRPREPRCGRCSCTSTSRSSKTSSRAGSSRPALGRRPRARRARASTIARRLLDVGLFGGTVVTSSTVVARSSSVRMCPSNGSGRLAAAEEGGHDAGEDREHEHDEDERQRRAPRPVLRRSGTAIARSEDLRRDSVVLVPLNRFQFVWSSTRPIVKSKRAVSPAARATASSAPLTIPASRAREHHRADRAGLAGSRARSCPPAARAGTSAASPRWSGSRSGASGTPSASAPAKPVLLVGAQHDERVDEQTHHDRRDAGHHLGQEAHEPRERALRRRTR